MRDAVSREVAAQKRPAALQQHNVHARLPRSLAFLRKQPIPTRWSKQCGPEASMAFEAPHSSLQQRSRVRIAFDHNNLRNRPASLRKHQHVRQRTRKTHRLQTDLEAASTTTQLQSETERFLEQLEQDTQADSQQHGSELDTQLQDLRKKVQSKSRLPRTASADQA